ncbi:RNase P modulator RnpM [Chloroflexota bacterium]
MMRTMGTTKKHIRQRTCVACGKVTAKRELIRLVRTPENRVDVDTEGKKAGRGAYLCPAPECWETGLKSNRLEHALRTTITPDNREQMIRYGKDLLQGAK